MSEDYINHVVRLKVNPKVELQDHNTIEINVLAEDEDHVREMLKPNVTGRIIVKDQDDPDVINIFRDNTITIVSVESQKIYDVDYTVTFTMSGTIEGVEAWNEDEARDLVADDLVYEDMYEGLNSYSLPDYEDGADYDVREVR